MRQRPIGVTLLAILLFAGSAMWLAAGVGYLMGWFRLPAQLGVPPEQTGAVATALILFALFGLAIALGLWFLKNWARLVAVVLSALGVGFAIIGLGYAIMYSLSVVEIGRRLLSIFIRALILWYLTQPHVKQAFSADPEPTTPAPYTS